MRRQVSLAAPEPDGRNRDPRAGDDAHRRLAAARRPSSAAGALRASCAGMVRGRSLVGFSTAGRHRSDPSRLGQAPVTFAASGEEHPALISRRNSTIFSSIVMAFPGCSWAAIRSQRQLVSEPPRPRLRKPRAASRDACGSFSRAKFMKAWITSASPGCPTGITRYCGWQK